MSGKLQIETCGGCFISNNYMKYSCIWIRAVKVSALIDAINVAAINALKYFNSVYFRQLLNCIFFLNTKLHRAVFSKRLRPISCVYFRCALSPDTKPPRANVASALHRRHRASSLICNFIKVNTNMFLEEKQTFNRD